MTLHVNVVIVNGPAEVHRDRKSNNKDPSDLNMESFSQSIARWKNNTPTPTESEG